MQRCCGNICFLWSKRYLVLKDSFMLYMKQDEGRISSVLLFDRHFNVHMADPTEVHGGIVIENMSRTLTVKCASYRQALWWLKSVQEFVETHKSPYLQENRFGSFAPPRDAIPVKWYVNAAEYFLDVAYALESAQEEIFITDWWLSPEIYLKRPPVEGNYWRLDYVLKRRAEAGVRVYVLLYKEVELALGINSGYSKHTLMNAHENIKVIRHPDHVASTVFFWAHHEKLVVIDQTLAFLGGIDLAYGRWDDHQHRLTDVGSVAQRISPQQEASPTQEASPSQEASPTQEASPSQETTSQDPLNSPSNSEQMHSQDESVTGNTDLTDGATSEVEPDSVPRISAVGAQGWSRLRKVYHTQESVLRDSTSDQQDAAGDRVDGKDASSTLEGIVHRWRNVLRQKLHREDPQKNNLNKHKMDIWEDYGTVRPSSVELFGEARFWHGKDYCNCVFKDWVQLDKPLDDFIDRHVTPRMPWHDIGVAVQGGTARDVARHFIQRWNFAWTEKKKKSIMTFPKLLPKSLSVPTRPSVQLKGFLKANVQLLRSASDWSAGIKEPEKSIHDAYIDTINNSKHFIYIENQFFVSCADDKTIFNGIGDAITNRIIKAYREKQHFRVYVVVPLLPGFEGDLTTGGGNAIQAVMHFNYRTICRGKYSIVERLKVEMDDMWVQFISFCSLRTHAELGGRPITELIYVHSKMLIADDRTVIIGSANINDRSMLGRRDSELAVVVSDTEFVPSTMDGQPYEAGKFAGSLRNNCFRLILGLLDQPNVDISDVVSEHFFKDIWTVTAGRNATIFDKVFKCIPSDFILNSEQLACKDTHDALIEQDGDKARQKLKGVQGFLVQFPLLFLQEQNLMPAIHTKEGIMPTELWT
uniref:Phospholipase n=1 Tax=Eptatretus burgeri TaxID=7764 RepID=A0A8C4QK67_EPTBU